MSKVIVVGDALVSSSTLEKAAHQLSIEKPIEVTKYEWNSNVSKHEFRRYIKLIETNGPENVDIPQGILEDLQTADYLLVHYAPVSKEMIENAAQLKLVGTCRGGMEHVNIQACKEKEIPVIHVIRNAEPVADFTIGLMYAETRNIARAHHNIMKGKWVNEFANDSYKTTLSNMKVGILGLGNISKLVVKRLNAMDVEVLAYSKHANAAQLKSDGLKVSMVDFETLFSESDIVSLHARVTPKNMNLVNKNVINLMKPSSYLINTARPELINRKDLIDALQNHRIAGAALDVFWEEPIDSNDELLKLENVTLTSHIGGDTVDAIPNSPYLLRDAINDYLKNGVSDMLVSFR
ncbi:2-hydroxyacid dehydrogenase [Oceanobacillus alkalisoli]|uniref:2-hydroxyacid dehydrogenase n=1 Tax=Oceanobacillus alkalisoli TaxID=2925113 RepID=UPI001F12214C|nr:2-hydroxyacid dehydrogenase [Oceanobacillus alkalisoli]MCF3944836.1 2-hydroxyacid dehydrogenase [Oceanobacillus alkalisoli]